MVKKSNLTKTTLFILILFLIAITGYIVYADCTGKDTCIVESSKMSSCDAVSRSKYGEIFGIKLNHFGLLAFTGLFIIFLGTTVNHKYRRKIHHIYLYVSILGSIFATYFIYLQFFVLKTVCSSCLIIDTTMILVTIVSFADFFVRK